MGDKKIGYCVSYAWKGAGHVTKSRLYYRPDLKIGECYQACDALGVVTARTSGYMIDTSYTSGSETDVRVALALPKEDDELARRHFVEHASKLTEKLRLEADSLRSKAVSIRNLEPVDAD